MHATFSVSICAVQREEGYANFFDWFTLTCRNNCSLAERQWWLLLFFCWIRAGLWMSGDEACEASEEERKKRYEAASIVYGEALDPRVRAMIQ